VLINFRGSLNLITTGLYPFSFLENGNIALFEWLRAAPDAPHFGVLLARVMAELPVYLAAVLLLVYLVRHRAWQTGIAFAIALLCSRVIESVIKVYAYHARPFAAGFGPALVEHAANNSMPSSHATFVWTAAAIMALYGQRKMAGVLTGLGLVVAWARIYVGIHWPMDMVGAAMVAILCALLGKGAQHLMRPPRLSRL